MQRSSDDVSDDVYSRLNGRRRKSLAGSLKLEPQGLREIQDLVRSQGYKDGGSIHQHVPRGVFSLAGDAFCLWQSGRR